LLCGVCKYPPYADLAAATVIAAAEANINPGLNRDSLNMFANLCGIPHSGNGGCRRMARQRARSATRGSSSASSRTTTRSSTRN
jgi:hypothetical protein